MHALRKHLELVLLAVISAEPAQPASHPTDGGDIRYVGAGRRHVKNSWPNGRIQFFEESRDSG